MRTINCDFCKNKMAYEAIRDVCPPCFEEFKWLATKLKEANADLKQTEERLTKFIAFASALITVLEISPLSELPAITDRVRHLAADNKARQRNNSAYVDLAMFASEVFRLIGAPRREDVGGPLSFGDALNVLKNLLHRGSKTPTRCINVDGCDRQCTKRFGHADDHHFAGPVYSCGRCRDTGMIKNGVGPDDIAVPYNTKTRPCPNCSPTIPRCGRQYCNSSGPWRCIRSENHEGECEQQPDNPVKPT